MTPSLKEILEALIFISLEPLSMARIKEVLSDYPEAEIEQAAQSLLQDFAASDRGIQVVQAGGGFIFSTKSEFDPWIKRLLKIERKSKLTSASLETLSIIAYHQPITLSEISTLRGVDSSATLKTLLQKKLIRIIGRRSSPGKPLIYRTTDRFLAYFGLKSLEELPSEEEIARILGEEKDIEQK